MWSIVTAVGQWLSSDLGQFGDLMTLIGIDDGERVCQRMKVVGCMFLSALDAIDHAGALKVSSRFRDLGLVMSLYLNWSWGLEDYGVGDDGECEWRRAIVAYAKKAGIDLLQEGAGSDFRRAFEEYGRVPPLKSSAKVGRWKWPKTVSWSQH